MVAVVMRRQNLQSMFLGMIESGPRALYFDYISLSTVPYLTCSSTILLPQRLAIPTNLRQFLRLLHPSLIVHILQAKLRLTLTAPIFRSLFHLLMCVKKVKFWLFDFQILDRLIKMH